MDKENEWKFISVSKSENLPDSIYGKQCSENKNTKNTYGKLIENIKLM